MASETIFKICSAIAMIGWIVLAFVTPFWSKTNKFIIGVVVALLCIVYTWLIIESFGFDDLKSFGTLDGVALLFQDRTLLTAGWVHYLAFDLFVGTWITMNGRKHGINHWLLVPLLLLTFMLGPVGLLIYLLVRWWRTRHYFSENH